MTAPVYLQQLGIVCSLGRGKAVVADGLFRSEGPTGLTPGENLPPPARVAGRVRAELTPDAELPPELRSRNNRLLLTALSEIRVHVDAAAKRFGASRVGVVLGTSTSGAMESEAAISTWMTSSVLPSDFHIAQQEMGSPTMALSQVLGVSGPALVISTACSSSAKALASAARLLRSGQCDAVVAGGVDSLCRFTLAGFGALEAISPERSNPMSANRRGINIGEGAALFLMGLEPGPVQLSGWGESSDAHHISAPEPSGAGALAAMREALARAELDASDIGYVNLHGTGTQQNDAMESLAIHTLFGATVPTSSTKPLTGHTLGAAGALEAAFCWMTVLDAMAGSRLPPHWWDGVRDEALPEISLVKPGQRLLEPVRHVLSNSFAFGGSNASLVLSRGVVRRGA